MTQEQTRIIGLAKALDKALVDNHKSGVQVKHKLFRDENNTLHVDFKFIGCDSKSRTVEKVKSLIDNNFCESLMYMSETKSTVTYRA